MDLETNNQIQIPNKDSQINVVLTPNMNQGYTVDLVNVFHNMKLRKRFFAWVLLFCMLLGISASLLMYQINKPVLKVSSIVTFDYDVLTKSGKVLGHVTDMTAPDGTRLDLEQLTSSYVLQRAIDMTGLSKTVTVASLCRNIQIERNLTEDSKRQMEVAAQMVTDKNNAAYTTISNLEQKYENRIVVTLANGFTFGDDDKNVIEIEDGELHQLLDNILYVYNEYLVLSYGNQKLPDDEFSVIDIEGMDLLESLDLVRSAITNLYNYCNKQPVSVKEYRSSETGYCLPDLMDTLNTVKLVNVNYLYSYVYTNSLAKDTVTTLTSYEFQLRKAENQREQIRENISITQTILDTYKNDKIYVSMQDSDTSRSTQTTTDYYNELVLQQAQNYSDLAEVETQITDLENKIANLKGKQETALLSDIDTELAGTLVRCKSIYQLIRTHMSEIFASAENNTYAQRSAAYGKTQSFLAASAKNMIIGAVAGVVIACGLWFMSGLIKEMKRGKKFDDEEMEAND